MYVWLIVVELVFFFLGSCGIFLKDQVYITPKTLSDEGPGSMVQLRFRVPTIPACISET